jgi:hypothetical protein
MVRNAAPLVHETKLILYGQSYLGHGMGLEFWQREIEVFSAIFDEPFEHEARNIDELLDTLKKDGNRGCFIQEDRNGACFPAYLKIPDGLKYQARKVGLGAVLNNIDSARPAFLKVENSLAQYLRVSINVGFKTYGVYFDVDILTGAKESSASAEMLEDCVTACAIPERVSASITSVEFFFTIKILLEYF